MDLNAASLQQTQSGDDRTATGAGLLIEYSSGPHPPQRSRGLVRGEFPVHSRIQDQFFLSIVHGKKASWFRDDLRERVGAVRRGHRVIGVWGPRDERVQSVVIV